MLVGGKEEALQHLRGGNDAAVCRFHQLSYVFEVFDDPLILVQGDIFGMLVEVAKVDGGADVNAARIGLLPPSDEVEQGRLANAVGADDADAIAGIERIAKVANQRAPVIAFAEIRQFNHLLADATTGGGDIHFALGLLELLCLHFLDAVDARFLLGAAGFGAAS